MESVTKNSHNYHGQQIEVRVLDPLEDTDDYDPDINGTSDNDEPDDQATSGIEKEDDSIVAASSGDESLPNSEQSDHKEKQDRDTNALNNENMRTTVSKNKMPECFANKEMKTGKEKQRRVRQLITPNAPVQEHNKQMDNTPQPYQQQPANSDHAPVHAQHQKNVHQQSQVQYPQQQTAQTGYHNAGKLQKKEFKMPTNTHFNLIEYFLDAKIIALEKHNWQCDKSKEMITITGCEPDFTLKCEELENVLAKNLFQADVNLPSDLLVKLLSESQGMFWIRDSFLSSRPFPIPAVIIASKDKRHLVAHAIEQEAAQRASDYLNQRMVTGTIRFSVNGSSSKKSEDDFEKVEKKIKNIVKKKVALAQVKWCEEIHVIQVYGLPRDVFTAVRDLKDYLTTQHMEYTHPKHSNYPPYSTHSSREHNPSANVGSSEAEPMDWQQSSHMSTAL